MTTKKFKGKCPLCGSDNIEYQVMEPVDEIIVQQAECGSCGCDLDLWAKTNWFVDYTRKKV